jgi:hypothetical protein
MRAWYLCAALAALIGYTGLCAQEKRDDKDKEPREPVRAAEGMMPGFPDVKADVSLLNVSDKANVPVLKVGGGYYDEDRKEAFWLVELEADIVKSSPEAKAIDMAWGNQEIGDQPEACFFDKNKVLVSSVKMAVDGRLVGGKKGDRVRLAVKADKADKNMARVRSMEVRKPAAP